MMEFEPLSGANFGRTQPPEYQPDTWGMLMPLPGTDGVVSGVFEPLLDMGRGRSSVIRSKLDAGVEMDRGKRDEKSRVEGTNSAQTRVWN